MPARGAGGGGAINPNRIKASKPAPKTVVFKPAQVSTPTKRAAQTFKKTLQAEHAKAQHAKAKRENVLGRPLKAQTKQNYETGGRLRRAVAEGVLHEPVHKRGVLGTIAHGLDVGEHAVEGGVQSTLKFLRATPGGLSNTATMNESEREAQRAAGAKVITQAAEFAVPFAAAKALRGAAKGLESVRAARGASAAGRAAAGGSRALKVGAAGSAGYGKLLVTAAPAKAAIEAAPSGKKAHEGFAEKLYNSAVETIANLPAGVIESGKHPIKTLEAMADVYAHPKHAFDENPFGTALAFLAPTTAVDRLAGAGIRGLTGSRYLATDRAALEYAPGLLKPREYQKGALAGTAERVPDAVMKKLGKGEAELRPGVNQATKRQSAKGVGDRFHGVITPSQIDMLKGGQRLAHNVNLMERRHFLQTHLGHDSVRTNVLMTFLQGEAKRPETFWEDVANRHAELKDRATKLEGNNLRLNLLQQEKLTELERSRSKIDPELLKDAANSAGEIGKFQREDWHRLNQQGIGEPNQLNARNLTAVLSHGHLLGRGELKFVDKPGESPLQTGVKRYQAAKNRAAKHVQDLKGKPGREHDLEEATARYHRAAAIERQYRGKLDIAKLNGAVSKGGEFHPGVYDESGKRVTQADVQKLLDEHFEGREMGFLSHKDERVAAQQGGAFGPRTTYPMRTGENFQSGTYDNSPAALRDHFDRVAHTLSEMSGQRQIVEKVVMGKGREDGKTVWFKDQKEAEDAAKGLNVKSGGELVHNHLGPYVAYKVGPHKVADLMEPHPFGELLGHAGHVEHQAMSEEGGTYGVVPKKIADRLKEWEDTEQKIRTSDLRMITNPWRHTNLYTSVRWPVGTTQENAIRLAAARTSPLVVLPFGKHTSINFKTGSHIETFLKQKIEDPNVPQEQKDWAMFHKSMFGTGNFVGSQLMQDLEGAKKILDSTPKLQESFNAFPGTKAWDSYKHWVGNSLAKMETNAKIAVGGRLARDDAGFFSTWKGLTKEQAAKNYVDKITGDPVEAIRAAEKLIDVVGNWNHLTPKTRNAQATWAPFSLWWLNSARFIFKTMPKDHPYATGLLAAMVTATGAANRDLKGFLNGTVPLDLPLLGKINLNPVHYSPFDIAHEAPKTAASMVIPQISEPLLEIAGVDPLTKEKYEGGEGVGPVHFLEDELGSYVPGVRIGQQLAAQGGKYGKDTLFPWETKEQKGVGAAALKTFFPLPFTRQTKKQKEEAEEGSSGSSYGGAGGYGGGAGGYGGGGGYGSGGGGYGK